MPTDIWWIANQRSTRHSAGILPKKYKELIAVGISTVIDCESCLEWHIRQAVNAGAKNDEILEAIEVGMEMGGGPATVTSRFALKALEYYTTKDTTREHKR
jgi:AhpD family alkylhydroperoxidase